MKQNNKSRVLENEKNNIVPIVKKVPNFIIHDADAVFDVANILGAALEAKPPYIFEIEDENGKYRKPTNNREELLDFYIEWAMHELYDLIDDEHLNKKESASK